MMVRNVGMGGNGSLLARKTRVVRTFRCSIGKDGGIYKGSKYGNMV